MSLTHVSALQGDTMDRIAYRYFGSNAVVMLPALLNANPDIQTVILAQHQRVILPPMTEQQSGQALKLWD